MTGVLKTTVWLVVVLLMVAFLYTVLAGSPVSGDGPPVGSMADQMCEANETTGSNIVSHNGKRYDKDCLEKWNDESQGDGFRASTSRFQHVRVSPYRASRTTGTIADPLLASSR